MDHILFFKRFITNPTRIGALCPSSIALCQEMVKDIGIESAKVIVELGPGTGVITRQIITNAPEESKFFAVELDKDIYNNFVSKHPEINIYNDSAENLNKLLHAQGLHKVDAIISGLPWASFNPALQTSILNEITSGLKDGGYFTTFAYLQGLLLPAGIRFRKLLKKHFRNVEFSPVVWKNLPPAIVYRCKK